MIAASATRRNREQVLMCSPVLCSSCHKVTWTGCGLHIEEALEGVPQEQRCTCR